MLHALLGTKLSQTQTFTEEGKRIPVTVILAGPNWITAITDMPNGKKHVQLGFGSKKNLSKAQIGHLKKAGLTQQLRFLRSVNVDELTDSAAGSEVKVESVFAVGDSIRVTATSKGKGFAGVVKRHKFRGGPRTHGQSDRERAPGSIGQTTTPGRVYKGKRMAGRMGNDTVTVRGLKVVSVDPQTQMVTIKGLVPGGVNSLVFIQKELKAVKK